MTIGAGKSAGSDWTRTTSASTPPADAPTTTSWSAPVLEAVRFANAFPAVFGTPLPTAVGIGQCTGLSHVLCHEFGSDFQYQRFLPSPIPDTTL